MAGETDLDRVLAVFVEQMKSARTYQEHYPPFATYVAVRLAAGHKPPFTVPGMSGKPSDGTCAYCGSFVLRLEAA